MQKSAMPVPDDSSPATLVTVAVTRANGRVLHLVMWLLWSLWSLWLLAAPCAWAETSPVTLQAATSLGFDSNPLRLPANTNALQSIGKISAADQINATSLGLGFDTRLGLQTLKARVTVAQNAYQNFSFLNHSAINYTVGLSWSITPRVHGTANLDRTNTLNPVADGSALLQRNQRTDIRRRVDAVYEVDGPWRILAGVSQFDQSNQQALPGSDFASLSFETGLRYETASGNHLTINHRSTRGQYLSHVGGDFTRNTTDLQLHRTLGSSTVDLSVGQFSQSHAGDAALDFGGSTVGLGLSWPLLGKSALDLGLGRTLASYLTGYSTYSRTDRITVAPVWQIGPKSLLRLRYEWAQTDYLGDPGGALPDLRHDITRDAGVTFLWQPDARLTLGASLQSVSRGSSLMATDYDSRLISILAQYSYH